MTQEERIARINALAAKAKAEAEKAAAEKKEA